MLNKRIGISILDCDFMRLEDELGEMMENGVTNVHIDVMDTSFVGNLTFGPCVLNRILKHEFVFDIHMMIEDPIVLLPLIDLSNVFVVTVHQEASGKKKAIEYLRDNGVMAGIAINPETRVEEVDLSDAGFSLVMTVNPGFGGQQFKSECVCKIDQIKKQGKLVGVDGGLNASNIAMVKDADYVVVGSGYFRAEDRREYLTKIRRPFLG
ncbi:ribulose-5-phosphate 3-epimerase [Ordospora colligata]|uniref:Ribulose-phosphate 3-epimerase n=1 Tax=Ordospora colligata OC4 TaxID=1354746 RepID=A0A0B2UEC5_9MICR|nr:ribulose-5-phosphate 3-epimerase [Ordospora colligata OC4]KHN69441.1 ribulose-5-phosphate 3-epimerase [Ordospora colligata OC4]TBU15256.1 ribulose-5-phosphate 3-epimerase [Ordospora colligata]TBU18438.1 ribulose-5-phosphate 3-epimerase [Ordospora colligata]